MEELGESDVDQSNRLQISQNSRSVACWSSSDESCLWLEERRKSVDCGSFAWESEKEMVAGGGGQH
ncbi:hypothetical protein Csa_016277 [Cucumis sativus]|uniref:Uncharacterized protein n=1 Tax=Cucumis sativus TaxID=3659 RepID=A0A0A0K699_CUCSA|nr:hypothetical protein Csa_016277 [Cucumis sativus]